MSGWPMLLDMTRDDCKRHLRRLELEAYASIVTAMRAQGVLSAEKRKLLQDLCTMLNISMERHKAEIRRVANDERLATVAELMSGPNSAIDWAIEGRRLIPLLPRLVPQTAFTALANNVANITAAENASLPPPSQTVKTKADSGKDQVLQNEPGFPESAKTPKKSASPVPANHMMLPPGTSIRLKKDGDEEFKGKKRSRSTESEPSPKLPPVKMSIPPHQRLPMKSSYPVISTPIKITPLRSTAVTHSHSTSTQKVIIVSSSASLGSSTSSSILQRSLSGPLMKPPGPFANVGQQLRGSPSVMLNAPAQATAIPPASSVANIASMSATPSTSSIVTAASSKVPFTGASTAAYQGQGGGSGVPKIRPMTLQLPAKPRPRTSSIIIPTAPGGPSQQRPILQTVRPNLQPKLDSMHVKAVGISNATKILPKPSFAPSSVSPMYVMSTSSPAPITMITRAMPTNISPRVNPAATTSSPVIHSLPAVSTKHPFKTIQKVKVGACSPGMRQSGGKTNVIVVQKGATSGYTRGVTLAHGVKQETGKKLTLNKVSTASHVPLPVAHTIKRPVANVQLAAKPQTIQLPANTKQGSSIILLDMSKEGFSKNTVLADILQASGIPLDDPDGMCSEEIGDHEMSSTVDMTIVDEQVVEKPEDVDAIDVEVKNEGLQEQQTLESGITVTDEDIFGDSIQISQVVQPVQTVEDRTITIEEAVQLLGHSDSPETRALLSQAGIEVRDHVPELNTSTEEQPSIPQVVHEEDVVSMDNDVMEVLGELDPQTGVYSIHTAIAGGSTESDTTARDNPNTTVPMDIYSTALATANINLDSFQYLDDGVDSTGSTQEYATFTETKSEQTKESDSNQDHYQVEDSSGDNYEEFLQPNLESTAVMVEPSHMDTSEMYIEDFASQKM